MEVEVKEEPIKELSRKNERLFVAHQRVFQGLAPEEIWLMILNLLNNSDKQSASKATPYFWEILKKDRVLFLFSDVLAILSPMFEGRKYSIEKLQSNGEMVDIETGRSHTEFINQLQQEGTMALAYAPFNDLWWKTEVLKCRVVCSTWKNGVEEVYQRAEMQGIQEFSKDMDPSSMMNTMLLDWPKTFIRNGDSQMIMTRFRDPPRNPFLSRHVIFSHRRYSIAMNQHYFDELLEMLRLFGKEIRYCKLQLLVVDYGDARRNRSKFLEFLNLMPNLEYLCIHGLSVNLRNGSFGDEPIPVFKNLKMLKLGREEPGVVMDLLRGNNHVKSLMLSRTYSTDVVTNLPNLTSFKTESSFTGERMLDCLGSKWRLERIQVCRRVAIWPAADAFRFLEKNFGDTLTDVYLSDAILDAGDRNIQLNLPNVKRFTLTSAGSLLDFTLPMKKMEHLEIKRVYESSEDSQIVQQIQFSGFIDKMHESNIWELFPKLKTIKLHDSRTCATDARLRFRLYTNRREKYIYYGSEP